MAAVATDELNRRRVAVLAADLCGYSRLMSQDEQGTLARLLADRRVIGEIVDGFDGRIFNTAGDALLAEFDTSAAAVSAAVAIQQRIEQVNASGSEARPMRYRIGVTVGDVVDEGGDLLGDAVNIASRLEKLAEPGGLCLSQTAFETIAEGFPHAVRDIGSQRLRNIPKPVRAYLITPEAIGGASQPAPRRILSVAATALAIALVAGGIATVSVHRSNAVGAGRAATAAETMVFAPDAELPPAQMPAPSGRFALDALPFVNDAARAEISAAMAVDPGTALAVSRSGVVGLASHGRDPAEAGEDAIRRCFDAGGLNCRLYAVDGRVVWPEPLPPMPAGPWVDSAVPPTPFDADRIAGLRPEHRRRLAEEYTRAKPFKALALGPHGTWQFTSDKASAAEAERLALERCGDSTGTPCRIVAAGNSFVVPLRKP